MPTMPACAVKAFVETTVRDEGAGSAEKRTSGNSCATTIPTRHLSVCHVYEATGTGYYFYSLATWFIKPRRNIQNLAAYF